MSEPTDFVTEAVENCLAYAKGFDSPAAAACDFVALLKMGGGMTQAEVAEVATRVMAALGKGNTQSRKSRRKRTL